MDDTAPHLREPLPPESVTRRGGIAAYRRYPVFSAPWLWRRSLVFGSFAFVIGALSGLPMGFNHHDWPLAFALSAHGATAFVLMTVAGPILATIVRHRRWRPRAERIGVVAAIVAGVLISSLGDLWASTFMEAALRDVTPVSEFGKSIRSPFATMIGNAFALGLYFTLGGGLALRAYFSEHRRFADAIEQRRLAGERLQHQQTGLRLAVLQAQVEPHFLFNTLASLRSLVETDTQRATAMIDALVAYLRGTIPQLREDGSGADSTLAQQMAICENYLRLIGVRMGARLSYRIELPEDLRDEAFPPLMLISLVENAIKHGVEPKRGPGCVVVRAEAPDATRLRVLVSDDGAGLSPGLGVGLGLANIRAQLATRYGDAARLELSPRAGGGVEASITLPRERDA
jgi:signal transduction histidine kinase